MSQDIYIINNFPGTAGYLVSGLIHKNYLSLGLPVTRDDGVFDEDKPDVMTPEWFYNHWSVSSETTSTQVCNVPVLPDFAAIRAQYPDAKLITITHDVVDCDIIATNVFYAFYVDGWDHNVSQTVFRNTIALFPQLFPDQTITPEDLPRDQRIAFIKILSHQALLGLFHRVEFPEDMTNIYEIKLHDMMYNPTKFKSQLTEILGTPLTEETISAYNLFLMTYHEKFYLTTK